MDPSSPRRWRALAKAYARVREFPELEKLRHDYWRTFGAPL